MTNWRYPFPSHAPDSISNNEEILLIINNPKNCWATTAIPRIIPKITAFIEEVNDIHNNWVNNLGFNFS